MRLDRFLSEAGLGSRKQTWKLVKKGKVKVNSVIVRDPGFKVDPEKDKIEVDGRVVSFKRHLYYKFYKPKGYITSTRDSQPTVMDLLSEKLSGISRIFPSGRLDKDAEGLLLLTSNGTLAHRIFHPKWKLPKTYQVKINRGLELKDKEALEKGVELSEGKTRPCKIKLINQEGTFLEVTVFEGRYHLLKRMFGKLGYRVLEIKRIAIGPLKLGNMKPGEVKELTEKELKALKRAVALKD